MKHSKPLSVLILIASALLLSAARNVSADELKHHRSQNHQADTTPQAKPIENKEPEVPLAVWEATISALRESITDNKQQAIAAEKQAEADKQTFGSPAVVINELLALVGVGYLFIMYLQWRGIDEQASLTYELVHADRPFLIPEKQALSGQWPSLADFERGSVEYLTAQMTLRNCGKGPAVLDDAIGRLRVVDKSFIPSADTFDDCYALIITPTNAFAAGETTDCVSHALMLDNSRAKNSKRFGTIKSGSSSMGRSRITTFLKPTTI
jgi:hypothetical protein